MMMVFGMLLNRCLLKIDSIRAIEYRDQLIIGNNPSGILVNSQVVVQISDTNEIWLTPDLVTHGTTLYSIGSIDYGVESRMFVMAYGRRQPNRVFVPAYRVIDASGVPTTHVTGRGTETKSEGVRVLNTEEERVLVKDETGNYIKSGLVFCSNGQFLQSFNYETDLPYDMYVTVEIVPQRTTMLPQRMHFMLGSVSVRTKDSLPRLTCLT